MRLFIVIPLLMLGCAPKKSTPVEEIPKLTKLDDVMANQAGTADPLFKKIGQSAYSEAEFAAMSDASTRLSATSAKIKDFTKGAEFDALADRLGEKARALGSAATAKDAAA